MQLRPEALDTHLQKGLAQLYVISSDEHLLALEAADKIRSVVRQQGYSEREVLTVDRSFKWAELHAANNAMSLFGDQKLIELRMPGGRPGKEGSQSIQSYVTALNPSNITLITLPKLDWATQKSAWVSALQKTAVYIDIPLVERPQLPAWITARLKLQNQSMNTKSIEFLVDRVEGNLLAAHQEIQKLGLLYPEGVLNFEQIRDSVLNVARYDVFKLNEAMLAGDVKRLVRMMDGLKGEGEPLPLVLWAITEEIRTMLQIQSGLEEGQALSVLLKNLRIRSPRERLIQMALKRLTSQKLKVALQQAAQVDKIVKGLRSNTSIGDAWDALLQLALSVARV